LGNVKKAAKPFEKKRLHGVEEGNALVEGEDGYHFLSRLLLNKVV
jgi:hypothetical protein